MNKKQKGFVLWFTGLPCSGKSTIANGVYDILKKEGYCVERLDGDEIRKHVSKDLGFSKEDRSENIKRTTFIAQLLNRNNIGVIASFVSPYQETRRYARNNTLNFIEIYLNTPLETCEKRDTKNLYKKAREGQISNFTGISDPYEKPENPEITLDGNKKSPVERIKEVVDYLKINLLK